MRSCKPARVFTGYFPLTTIMRCPQCDQGMIGKRVRGRRYYTCSSFSSKGSAICKSNLVYANEAEDYVYNKLEQLTAQPSMLAGIVERVNTQVSALKQPIQEQIDNLSNQLSNVEKNISKFLDLIVKTDSPPISVLDKLSALESEKKEIIEKQRIAQIELNRPTIKEVSFEHIQHILKHFSKIIKVASPEKQKDLLHAVISRISINQGNHPEKRSVKDIELVFDASLRDNVALTYGTVPRG